MELTVTLIGNEVEITLAPDTDVEMAAFGRVFPESEIAPGRSGDTMMLQVVRVRMGRADFRRRLEPLGLKETGGAAGLRVGSIARADLDAMYSCVRLDPRHSPEDCQNLTATDRTSAELACEIMARANHWFAGETREGSCSI